MHTSPLAVAASIVATVFIFLLSRIQNGGTSLDLLYLYVVPVIMIALWSAPRDVSLVIAVAGVSTVLSLINMPVATFSEAHCSGLLSHLSVIGAIWLTAALSILRKRKERTTQWIEVSPAN